MLFEAFVGAFDQHGVGFLEERSRSFGGLQHFVEREVEIPRLYSFQSPTAPCGFASILLA